MGRQIELPHQFLDQQDNADVADKLPLIRLLGAGRLTFAQGIPLAAVLFGVGPLLAHLELLLNAIGGQNRRQRFAPIFVFGNHFLQGEIGLFVAVLGKISDVVRKEWMELGNVLHQLLAEKSLGVRVKHSKRLFTILFDPIHRA